MRPTVDTCFICGGSEFTAPRNEYRRCVQCGHEVLVAPHSQGFIVNDHLDESAVRRRTRLDRFQAAVLARFDTTVERRRLLDIGSASGRFLYHNASRYPHVTGVEITPECVRFSRQVLGLEIVEGIRLVPDDVSVATAWHALEHIPERQLLDLLDGLSGKMPQGARFLVSVPNAASTQYRWFGTAYAFLDVPNHLHQFTPESLRQLMERVGFRHIADVSSWPYNTFGYTQALLNVFTPGHNYLYYRLKRRSRAPAIHLDALNALLLPLFVPVGWLLGLADAAHLRSQGVITACFEKSAC